MPGGQRPDRDTNLTECARRYPSPPYIVGRTTPGNGHDPTVDRATRRVIDFCPATLSQARRLGSYLLRGRPEARDDLPIAAVHDDPDERADIVVSLDAFEHFDDPARILRIMDTYLAAGGKVIASFGPTSYTRSAGTPFRCSLGAPGVHGAGPAPLAQSFRPRQQAARITDCGLNKITVRRFERAVAESPFRFAAFEPGRFEVFECSPCRCCAISARPSTCTLIRKTDPVRLRCCARRSRRPLRKVTEQPQAVGPRQDGWRHRPKPSFGKGTIEGVRSRE